MPHTIFTAADGNYSLQAQVLAASLARTQVNNSQLIVLGNGWKSRDLSRLKSLESERLSIEVRSVKDEEFKSVRLSRGFPIATAYNILAPKYLLAGFDRLLYVDADTFVRKDLTDLFAQPVDGGVGACLDAHIGWVSSPSMWRPWREEGLAASTPYLNTGVMLIDTREWNERRLTEQTLDYLSRYELPCVDQDALNLVLRGDFTQLAPRYNAMPYHILRSFRYIDLVTPDSEIEEALTSPVILHFHRSFLGKPWERGCIHPARDTWRTLANEIRPGWRKTYDLIGFGRRRAARLARMLSIDERSRLPFR